MALDIFSADAWTRARDRYIEDLSEKEKQLFLNASLETIFYSASVAKKSHRPDVASQLQTFVAAIEQYGKALDVYANSSSLILCPLWGSVRVVLHVEYSHVMERLSSSTTVVRSISPYVLQSAVVIDPAQR